MVEARGWGAPRRRRLRAVLATATTVFALIGLFAGTDPSSEPISAAPPLGHDDVWSLIERSERAFALPADPAARAAYATSALAELSRPLGTTPSINEATQLLAQTWIASAATEQVHALRRSLRAAIDDPAFSGYADHALEVRAWEQLAVDGDRARARFTAVPRYLRNRNAAVTSPDGWVDDHEQHFDVELRYEEGWKLAEVATRRANGTTGP
jgi:hypothetical protein